MVTRIIREKEKFFQCEECFLLYKEESTAKRCENWCRKNYSCNLEITMHSLR